MKYVTLIIYVTISSMLFAQGSRVGNVNSNDIIMNMPSYIEAEKILEAEAENIEKDVKALQDQLEQQYQTYREQVGSYSAEQRKEKEDEMIELERKIGEIRREGQENLRNKEEQLLTPVIEKVDAAIVQVANDLQYDYVLDTSENSTILVSSPKDDITKYVMQKLGINKENKEENKQEDDDPYDW